MLCYRKDMGFPIERLVSGGQSGVDRAALDFALELGLACAGWCPKGRRAEDGVLPERYPLRETPSPDYAQRTEWNVRDSDATLVLSCGKPTGGTALTIQLAALHGKPCLVEDLLRPGLNAERARRWLQRLKVRSLNVAGPRESGAPGAYRRARDFLRQLWGL